MSLGKERGNLYIATMIYLISIEYIVTLSICYVSISTVYSISYRPRRRSQFVVLFRVDEAVRNDRQTVTGQFFEQDR